MAFAMVNLIRQARDTRGWTSAKLNAEIRRAAQQAGVSTASTSSLRVLISCWENDRQMPDATYQMLLQTVFDLPAAALGFDNNSAGSEIDGLQPSSSEAQSCLPRLATFSATTAANCSSKPGWTTQRVLACFSISSSVR
jgi:hypothetical protein